MLIPQVTVGDECSPTAEIKLRISDRPVPLLLEPLSTSSCIHVNDMEFPAYSPAGFSEIEPPPYGNNIPEVNR